MLPLDDELTEAEELEGDFADDWIPHDSPSLSARSAYRKWGMSGCEGEVISRTSNSW